MFDLLTCKKIIDTQVETFNDGPRTIFDIIFWIISLLIFIFALSLAWKCNKGAERILMVIIAFILPYIYLIGYFIYHKILGYPCDSQL